MSGRTELTSMTAKEEECSSGYGKPPWIFKGSALYQLHLVKSETARALIPKQFKLVEAFGYTLGGFFLASYEESPAGTFDELVVIAGTVWNPPTSCAWAARVLVSSEGACHHGRKDVGLPSHVAKFSKRATTIPKQPMSKAREFLNMFGLVTSQGPYKNLMDVQVTEIMGHGSTGICSIKYCCEASESKSSGWMGPPLNLSLPSFSGNTKHNPNLLKYSCHMKCRLRTVAPAKVSREKSSDGSAAVEDKERNLSVLVMLSKPILALNFNCLEMRVEAPIMISDDKSSSL